MHPFLADRLQCPACASPLDESLVCDGCGADYEAVDGIYDFAPESPDGVDALGDAVAREPADGVEDLQADYERYVTDEERQARRALGAAFVDRLGSLGGVTAEIAPGMEGMLPRLVALDDVRPVGTDISIESLRRLQEGIDAGREAYALVAADARELPFRTASFDACVTAGGFNNVASTGDALAEASRVLCDGARLLAANFFVDPDSESAERARELGVETAYSRERFEAAADEAGFDAVETDVVASAESTENPYDVMPVAGDVQQYAVVDLRA